MKPRLSVIIPFWNYGKQAEDILTECVRRIDTDELLVVTTDNYEKPSYTARVNAGLRLAHGDHLVVMSCSAWLETGSLRDLARDDVISSPSVGVEFGPFHGACFCMPRWIYEKHGGMREAFSFDYADCDFVCRMHKAGVIFQGIPEIIMSHKHGGHSHVAAREQKIEDIGPQIFAEKWANRLVREILESDP